MGSPVGVLLVPFLLAAATAGADPVAAPATAEQQEIPAPLKAMLDAAIASGSESDVAVIVKYARTAAPAHADRMLAIADKWRADRAAAQHETLRQASMFQLWRGRAEVGGWRTSGNSDTTGLSALLDLTREGLQWRHKLRMQADYQDSLGVTTREHYLAAYEPNYKIGPRSYLYGAAQYESDRFLGYDDRFSASLGAGYSAIRSSRLTLDLELGPAYRDTGFTDGTTESSIATRGSVDFDWKLTGGVTLTQDASAYLQRYNSTVSSRTALNAKLIGPLSAQLSYAVQYESQPPEGRVTTDTTSRASLVYSF